MRREPHRPCRIGGGCFRGERYLTHFLMVGAVQACTGSSRLAAFGPTSTNSRKSPKAAPLASACVRHIESALSPQLRRFTLPATRGQQTPPLSSSTFRPSHQERDKTRARSPLQAAGSSQEIRHYVGKSTSTSLDRLGSYHMQIVVIVGTGLIRSMIVGLFLKRAQGGLALDTD